MPILKQLVSGSSQAKRRSRMDLTREMISAPLGDFRHTMHVGRSGDAFGDTSFLSTRSGEPPRETQAYPHSPRPGLLSRTFRSSKRSQSVTRVDQHDSLLAPSGGSPTYVKNAMSLPFLNDEDGGEGCRVPSSLSSSPLRQSNNQDGRPSNGAAGARSPELDERSFGELMDLPFGMQPYGGGMKKAESVMSFHIDLGPSMLGDILGVMEKEDDDLGYEEEWNSEGRTSPPLSTHEEGEDGMEVRGEEEEEEEEEEKEDREEEQEEEGVEEKDKEEEVAEEKEEVVEGESEQPPDRPPSSEDLEQDNGALYTPEYTPELQPKHPLHLDSCSLSSSGSAAVEDKLAGQAQGRGDAADGPTFSTPPEDESHFSSFMEDEDDEIRV